LWTASSNTIINNRITTYSNLGDGFRLVSTSNANNISGNNVSINTLGYGIDITSGTSNIVSRNNFSILGSQSYGIYASTSASGNTFSDNVVELSGSGSGAELRASNNFTDNNITATGAGSYGMYVTADSNNNNITGGSIVSTQSYDYYFNSLSEYSNVNFTNTNFTAERKIFFGGTTPTWFNYNNETNGNIWLKTKASGSVNRTLVNWNNSVMQWNDSGTVTTTYNLTGLKQAKSTMSIILQEGYKQNPILQQQIQTVSCRLSQSSLITIPNLRLKKQTRR